MKTVFKNIVVWLLTLEARIILTRFNPFIIAVTGNLGKTSAKDAIYTALKKTQQVRRSEKSLNSEFGVPLTILGEKTAWDSIFAWGVVLVRGLVRALTLREYPHILILEVGADHPDDIKKIASWLQPDVSVVTGIPDIPVHVANFASADALANEKRELVLHTKVGGWVVLNADDPRAMQMVHERPGRTLTYGFSGDATFVGSHDGVTYEGLRPTGMQFRVNHDGSSVPLVIKGAVGRQHCYPLLAACAVASVLHTDLVSAAAALADHTLAPGRMRLIPGVSGSTIIDDSYNASPLAVQVALETLGKIETHGRKIAILGDMRELGEKSKEAHETVGKYAAEVLDMLYTVGEESKVLADAACEAGLPGSHIVSFGYRAGVAAARELKPHLKEGDVVLVKGSQNKIRLEEAVKELMANPSQAEALLVRQEKEWQNR